MTLDKEILDSSSQDWLSTSPAQAVGTSNGALFYSVFCYFHKHGGQMQLGEGKGSFHFILPGHSPALGKVRQERGSRNCSRGLGGRLLTSSPIGSHCRLSCAAQGHLPRHGSTRSGLGPSTPVSNQENTPQAKRTHTILQLRSPLPR